MLLVMNVITKVGFPSKVTLQMPKFIYIKLLVMFEGLNLM